ncbi:MAG: hypothetical protein ACE5D2_03880 [Fidelibacterota bacterium]
MNLKKHITLLCLTTGLLMESGFAQAQLEGQFFEYTTYYISSIDIQTGSSDVPFFRFRIYADQYPIQCKILFRASMVSPTLGMNAKTTILELETSEFTLKADLILDNRNFSSATSVFYDEGSPPNVVPIEITTNEVINASEFESMLSSIMTTGKLADGEYTFELELYSGPDLALTGHELKTIVVQTPIGINLESPGGELADTSFNVVYTTYPIFNWYSSTCTNCKTYIRVAEFKPGEHSVPDESFKDETMLPVDLLQEWALIDNITTYQYPLSNAKPLEYGKVYVWQVKNTIPTTAGLEDIVSPIYAFKIVNPGQTTTTSTAISDPLIQSLQQLLDQDQFNTLFGTNSPLDGFTPSGNFNIDGNSVDEASARNILEQLMNRDRELRGVRVQE